MLAKEKLTISTYVRNYLLQHQEITDLVGNRIFPSLAPEGTTSPFIIYERDAYSTYDTKFGIYMEEAIVLFEVVADDYNTGMDVAVAIHDILQGKHGGFKFDIIDSTEFYKENKFRQLIVFKIT